MQFAHFLRRRYTACQFLNAAPSIQGHYSPALKPKAQAILALPSQSLCGEGREVTVGVQINRIMNRDALFMEQEP